MAELFVVGKSVPRLDALDKVTGKARYCADVKLPGMLQAKILRSTYPHARIVSVDTSRAERVPGVRAIVTGKDAPDRCWGHQLGDRPVLARNLVRFAGEPVAALAADSNEIAEEAVSLIEVIYDELPAVFDAEQAMRRDSPVVHPDMLHYFRPIDRPGWYRFDPDIPNAFAHYKIRKGNVDEIFSGAYLVVENRYSTARIHHCAIEPHAAIVRPESDGGLTVWLTDQGITNHKLNLCRFFGMAPSRVRVIGLYIGGSFGGKSSIVISPITVLLALKARRPVKMVLLREEIFVDGTSREPMVVYIKDAAGRDGSLLARELKLILNAGAYSGTEMTIAKNAAFGAVATYKVPNFRLDSYAIATDDPPSGPFRGFGSTQVIWAIESQMDILAHRLGIDPLEIRRMNLLHEGDENVVGEITHSIGARQCLDKVAAWINWGGPHQTARGPWKRGKGIALGNKYTLAGTPSAVIVKVHEDGVIEIRHSAHEEGQGCNTVLAQIAAEEFGISIDKIKQICTDTAFTPYEYGTISSRTTYNTGNALRLACQDARRQIFELAAPRLGVEPGDLETLAGKVYVRHNKGKAVAIPDLFAPGGFIPQIGEILGRGQYTCPVSQDDPETGQGERRSAYYAHGAHAVEVAVNIRTGEVKIEKIAGAFDMGQPVNPKLCEAQIDGGTAMGIGSTLFEEMVMDHGIVTNPSFIDYRVPSVVEIPVGEATRSMLGPAPRRDGPFGAKGFSEGTLTPVAPAIANAIYDAIGIRFKDLPITREKVLEAIKKVRE